MSYGFRPQPKGFATKAIHAAQEPEQWNARCMVVPIYTTTTYKQNAPNDNMGYVYSRVDNPTRNVLERCLATLENANYCLTFSSGVGAINAVLSLLSTGDHLIVGDDIYGGTNELVRLVSSRCGIACDFVDPANPEAIRKAIKPKTKMVWVETPTNPTCKIADIETIARYCHEANKQIIVAVDNTFLTPYFQRPLELGADLVCYSLTKYINGHTDVIMGSVTTNRPDLAEQLAYVQRTMGSIPSPFDCSQVIRSLKTLKLRVEQHQANSIAVAKYLESSPYVEKVRHPALPSHPQHALTIKQTYGYTGIFSFYIKGGIKQAKAFLQAVKVFTLAESLGGYESLVELPALMTHASVPEADRKKLGITDTLIRVAVGLEEVEDLIADLQQALEAAQK